jgi:hypothetical protein
MFNVTVSSPPPPLARQAVPCFLRRLGPELLGMAEELASLRALKERAWVRDSGGRGEGGGGAAGWSRRIGRTPKDGRDWWLISMCLFALRGR